MVKKNKQIGVKIRGLEKILLPVLLFVTMTGCNENRQLSAKHAEVVYTRVAAENMTLISKLPGRVSALVVSEVRPQVDGIIQERLFEEGSDVVKGEVLYRIDPARYRAIYNTARAALEEAEVAAAALKRMEVRYRTLNHKNSKAISQQDLENIIADHAQARARVSRARAELETAAINLERTRIKAPVSGRIGRSAVTPGALVTANQPMPLAVIRQTDKVYVDIARPSSEVLRLRRALARQGMTRSENAAKARLTLEDGGPYTLTGSDADNSAKWIWGDLMFSEISVGQTVGDVNLRAVFPNPEGLLLPGMYVKAIIEEGVMEKAIVVPQRAVLTDGNNSHYAMVLEKSEKDAGKNLYTVAKRKVRLDRPQDSRWLIKSGIQEGDLIVVEGLQKAVPGSVVQAIPLKNEKTSLASRTIDTQAR